MKRIVALILAMCMLLALCACGKAEEPSPADVTTGVSEAGTAGNGDNADAGSTDIKRGGVAIMRRAGITPINPLETIAPMGDAVVYGMFFENLTWWDEENYSAKPWLAESWEYSEGGLQLDMKLVEDACFCDGSPLNAEAVKYTFDFYMDEETGHIQRAYLESLDSVEAVSEYVVRFNFNNSDSGFLTVLTQPIGYIMAPAAIDEYKETGDPEVFARKGGSGPFVLESMLDGESYTGVKNENYYRMGEDGQPLPYLDGCIVQVIGDTAVAVANLQSGDIDLIDRVQSVADIESLKMDENITMIDMAFCMDHLLYMNTTKAPFDDIRVREAMCWAIDRQDLIDTLAGGNGYVTPTIILPTQSYYSADAVTTYSYDPEKSKALLAEAGYPDGVTVELYYGTYSNMQQISELVQAQAKDAGFNIELVGVDGATNKQIWASYNEDAPAGMRLNDLGQPKVSPYVQFEYIFGPDALQNCSKWFDPKVGEMLNAIRAETDPDKSIALCVEFQEMIEEFIPIAMMHTVPGTAARRSWLEGIKFTGEGVPYATEAWLNK